MHGLDGVARRQLQAVAPVTDADPATLAGLGHDLTRTPASWAWLATGLGVAIAVWSVVGAPDSYSLTAESPPILWLEALAYSVVASVCLMVFIAHTVHQLGVVARIHRDTVKVDLFRLEPLYSFAVLTSATGIVLIAAMVYAIAAINLINGATDLGLLDVAVTVPVILVAAACFVVPLLGLHGRIVVEKDRRLAEVNAVLDQVIEELGRRVEAEEWDAMTRLNDALEAATSAVATVARISTWPWRPETLRAFLSAVALPIVLWLAIAGLTRIVGG
jgi:hypothetical protein